jgi:7-cyano-7-deazaguanine tRNA-ribosyltransferase
MMFALAVALGCDLFDSAAYALYARDGRYLTVRGTEHLDDLDYFPCSCPICTEYTPEAVREIDDETERHRLLAEHNLHVSFGEMRRIKQAIRRGNLLELVEARARGHPAMLDGYRALLDHAAQLEATDPVAKDAFLYLSAESARRPEVLRHHERLARLDPAGEVLLTEGNHSDAYDDSWRLVPPFGPVPRELADAYPLAGELPERTDRAAREAAVEGVVRLVEATPDAEFTLLHRDWPADVLDGVPDKVRVDALGRRGSETPDEPTDSYSSDREEDA